MKRKIIMILALCSIPTLTLKETSCFCFHNKNKVSQELVDISIKTFNVVGIDKVETGKLLYKEVRRQIGTWADPEVDESDIANDSNNIIIIIKNSSNDDIMDSSDKLIDTGTYTVKIKIEDDDDYFKTQDKTSYFINVEAAREQVDISNKEFSNPLLSGSNYQGRFLYTSVKNQISNWADPKIHADDISADSDYITITIKKPNGVLLNDDDEDDLENMTYTVIIVVLPGDIYFKALNKDDYKITVTLTRTKIDFKQI